MLSALTEEFEEIVTVAVNFHPRKTSEIYGERTQVLFNEKETITEGVLAKSPPRAPPPTRPPTHSHFLALAMMVHVLSIN